MAIRLCVLTPSQTLIDNLECQRVEVPTKDGNIGIETDHSPLLAELGIGQLRAVTEKGEETVTVSGGFAEVRNDEMVVMTPSAEILTDIDIERARQAKERAVKRMKEASLDPDIDQDCVQEALLRAINRISTSEEFPM